MNEGHVNRDIAGSYDYNNVRNWVKKRIEGKKVSDMSTLVMFQNPDHNHWVCYGVFLEKKIIQQFDSMGGGDVMALMNIYHWLHDSMQSEGQELISTDWCLYKTRNDNPRQMNGWDCGLFAIMLSLCIANDLPLNFVDQSIMERGRCQLWLHRMSLIKKQGEEPQQWPIDLITPTPTQTPRGSVVDLHSPTVPCRLTYQEMSDGGDEELEMLLRADQLVQPKSMKPRLVRKAILTVVRLPKPRLVGMAKVMVVRLANLQI